MGIWSFLPERLARTSFLDIPQNIHYIPQICFIPEKPADRHSTWAAC